MYFFQFFLRRTPQICRLGAEGDLSMVASWLGVCVTHRQGLAIIFGVMMIILNLCFKKFGFGLDAGSVVLVDFLHVLRSVEMRFISAPDPFK